MKFCYVTVVAELCCNSAGFLVSADGLWVIGLQRFDKQPEYTEVNPGEDALMTCKVFNKRGTCSWQKDNKVGHGTKLPQIPLCCINSALFLNERRLYAKIKVKNNGMIFESKHNRLCH
jgi:hypothetical protein